MQLLEINTGEDISVFQTFIDAVVSYTNLLHDHADDFHGLVQNGMGAYFRKIYDYTC